MTSIDNAREWATRYWERGFNCLPKREDANRPALRRYGKLRDLGIGRTILEKWWVSGVQICTGGIWGVVVIDLDGPEAMETWREWTAFRRMPATWECRSGGGGRHLYYGVPPNAGIRTRCGDRPLWKGDGRHNQIDLLADRALVVAPPSIHPRTKQPYEWIAGPLELERPAPLPGWLHALATKEAPRPGYVPPAAPVSPPRASGAGSYDWPSVIRAIPDLAAVAKSWGLRIAGSRPNDAGWVECHAIGREDRDPSASFSPRTGFYWEPGMARPLTFFQLATTLGGYPDFPTAVNALGDLFLGPRRRAI